MHKDEAKRILDSRHATYGDRVANMDAAAGMVNAYLAGVDQRKDPALTGADFAMIMALYKIYRFAVTPDYQDNIDDIEGYLRIVRECMEGQLIPARTAEEYQEIKRQQVVNAHPASNQERLAEEASMESWFHNVFKDPVGPIQNPDKELLRSELAKRLKQSWFDNEILGEELAEKLKEDIQEERLRLSEVESQRIAEERRIWRKNRSDG